MYPERKRIVKHLALGALRSAGAFGWCARRSLGHTAILCYHGLSAVDEHLFRPALFKTAQTFTSRLEFLRTINWPVIPLNEFVAGSAEPHSVVITIDDGFATTLSKAAPLLAKFGFPATLYLTSYYVERDCPVLNLVLQYAFWKTSHAVVAVDDLVPGIAGHVFTKGRRCSRSFQRLIDSVETLPWPHRESAVGKICDRLGLSYSAIKKARMFALLREQEIRQLGRYGISVEMHTHRHRFDNDAVSVGLEILENRRRVADWTGVVPSHFCYPSGVWFPEQFETLRNLEIESAVTCDVGLASAQSGVLKLPRIIDSEAMSTLELEAELVGVGARLRAAKPWLRRRSARIARGS